ncbi:MAG: hypothetical protein KGN76_09210 [Acidobacteriota bacterium]|nr:hypothetical protein [Acidobacteriota bacterium]
MLRRLAVVLLVGIALVTTGCLDIEETVTLNRNLSGQAGFSMKVDAEPLVPFMAAMQRQMQGKSGPPTAQDLAAARAEMLKDANPKEDFEKDKREMAQSLPPGVKLLNADFTQNGLKSAASAMFSFENLAALRQVMFDKPSSTDADQGGGPQNPVSQPFDGLEVKDQGSTILITSSVVDPMTGAKSQMQQMPMDAAMQQQFAAIFKGLRVAVKITAPFTIVEQNATRKEGNTLIWEFDTSKLQTMTPDQIAHGIRVVYKK